MIIDSIAAIKKIPVGTKLVLKRSLMSDGPSGRIVKQIRSKDLILTIDDPNHRNNGRDSYLTFAYARVEPCENGFRLLDKKTGEICAEYEFSK